MKTTRLTGLAAATLLSIALFPGLAKAGCPMEGLFGSCATTGEHNAKNIVETASAAGKFKTLLAAAQAAGLAETLQGEGPFTVFAPTDDAFAKLPKGTVESLLKPENKEKLAAVLKYHVVAGNVKLTKALEAGQGKTVLGPSLTIKFEDGRVKVGTANLVTADISASNGVIHVIDTVLLPPATESANDRTKARKLISLAIDRGVPLFNDGNPGACKAVYEVTAEALVNMPAAKLAMESRQKLTTALAKSKDQTSARDQAWTLRHALDDVYQSLELAD
jgi:transforming growth factor-beta-induced protein